MPKYSSVVPIVLLFCFTIYPFSSALALSTGTGYMKVGAGIKYNPDELEFFSGYNTLSAWTIAEITALDQTSGPESLARDSQSKIGSIDPPSWKVPADSSIAYGDSAVSITNSYDNALQPIGMGELTMSTANISNKDLTTFSNIMYFANVRAIADGSFTFYFDYEAPLAGKRDGTNEKIQLGTSVSLNRYDMYYDENGVLQWKNYGMPIERDYDRQWVEAENDALTTSIDDFSGQLSLTVNFKKDEMFYLDFRSQASILGYTEEQTSPVPEPATFILLGSGLAGLAFYRRKRK